MLELADDEAADDECGCVHYFASHPGGGPCTRTLPADPAEELPEWRCPCRAYRPNASPGLSWAWHAPTGSWAGVQAAS